jgi:hypothetical protein
MISREAALQLQTSEETITLTRVYDQEKQVFPRAQIIDLIIQSDTFDQL